MRPIYKFVKIERRLSEREGGSLAKAPLPYNAQRHNKLKHGPSHHLPWLQAPMAMPQAPAPTAPASPASRQQFAAAFPFDVTSDVIRSQGIGSLGRTA